MLFCSVCVVVICSPLDPFGDPYLSELVVDPLQPIQLFSELYELQRPAILLPPADLPDRGGYIVDVSRYALVPFKRNELAPLLFWLGFELL